MPWLNRGVAPLRGKNACPRTARSSRGFTLIELLVAISVMALIAVLSWRGIDGMVRTQEATRQRADDMLVLQAALGQWGADLDALAPLAHTTPLDWDGQVLRLTRRSAAVPDEGPVVVAWTRRDTNTGAQWLRWQSPALRTRAQWQQAWAQAAQWARTPGDAERRNEIALVPIDSWQLFYYRGGAWSNALSSAGTTSGTDASSAIPEGIRLQITLSPGGALAGLLVRDWVNPVLGGRRT
jgi:general secretion pathway protein J